MYHYSLNTPLRRSMRVSIAYNYWDGRAGLDGYVQFNKYTHTHTHKVLRAQVRFVHVKRVCPLCRV